MKHTFIILSCAICSMAFVACGKFANDGASKADTTELGLTATDEIEQFTTPDLIRSDINNGRVKQIIISSNADTTTVSFSKDGQQEFDKTLRIERDKEGRVTAAYGGDKNDGSEDCFRYCGNSCRISGWSGGYMEDGEPIGDWFAGYWFYSDSTSPALGYLADNFWEYVYSKCEYLEFDRYGNWTKRRVTELTYEEDAEPGEGKIYRRCVDLTDHLAVTKNEEQWHKIENELQEVIREHFTHEKETYIESRKIEYW